MKIISNNASIPIRVSSGDASVKLGVSSDNQLIRFKAKSSNGKSVSMKAYDNTATIGVNSNTVVVIPGTGFPYEGPYRVDPKFEEIVLNTKNKTLKDNVCVNPIDVQRVSNPSGGRTVYIGGVINA